MKIKVREICEKEIEVPDDTVAVDVEDMLLNAEIVIKDLPQELDFIVDIEATYQVQFPHQDWISLF